MINYELIENLRKKKRWSYKTVSQKIDCPVDIIKLWETGEMEPQKEDLKKLATLYEIDQNAFYIKAPKKKFSIIKLLIFFAIGCLFGILTKNYIYALLCPILNIILYSCIYNLYKYPNEPGEYPKSLFGLNITKNDKAIYFFESNIIAVIYTYITIILRVLNISFLIPNINIIEEKNVNTLLIMTSSYLLLMFLSFIIELVFGVFIKKNMRSDL